MCAAATCGRRCKSDLRTAETETNSSVAVLTSCKRGCSSRAAFLPTFCWETNIHVITWSRCGVTDRHPKHALQHAGGILGQDWSTWVDRYEPRDASRPHRAVALTLHVAEVSSCKYLVLSVSEAATGVCVRAHTLKPPGQL